jgi:sRNA-binding protein
MLPVNDKTLISKTQELSNSPHQENKMNTHNLQAHRQRLNSIRNAATWLCKTFPDSFSWEEPKPLKRNIQHDIYASLTKVESDQPSKTLIRSALNYYTSRYAYLKATLSHTHRVDLKAKQIEEICQTHKDHAQMLLQQKQAARKMLKEKQKAIEKSKS